MRQRLVLAITVGILFCQLTGGIAFGADLTVAVPVNVSNLPPQAVSAWVNCFYLGYDKTGNPVQIAQKYSSGLAPVNGAVNTIVIVETNIPDSAKTGMVKYAYVCMLALSPDATLNSAKNVSTPPAYPWAAPKTGTPIPTVQGNFP
jgi:hypothetical protein